MGHKFYDIHYHLFDLSHANILSYLSYDKLITRDIVRKLLKKMPFFLRFLPLGLSSFFPGLIARKSEDYIRRDAKNIRNLLSVIESATEYHFLYNEYYLTSKSGYFANNKKNRFSKIVLVPLLMDFGYKDLDNKDCFYNQPPAKPVINQVVDVLNSIWFYYHYDLVIHPSKSYRLKLVLSSTPKEKKLFEIYPFLGINTKNYDIKDIKEMFEKYFNGYEYDSPEERQRKLFSKSGTVKLEIEELLFSRKDIENDRYSYLFAGIKLYPPLGFDPWPENDPVELEKVRFLYDECIKKRLPITIHCSDSGFVASSHAERYTDPRIGWKSVLSNPDYTNLKINLAHMGKQSGDRREWRNTIVKMMGENKNVYGDCSCSTPHKEDYGYVNDLFGLNVSEKVLFGSDFMINLLWSSSYNEYLENFLETPYIDEKQKLMMCNVNPEKFLFG